MNSVIAWEGAIYYTSDIQTHKQAMQLVKKDGCLHVHGHVPTRRVHIHAGALYI